MTENQRKAIDWLMQYHEAQKDIEATKCKIEEIETRCNKMTKSSDSIMQDTGRKDIKGNKILVPIVVQTSHNGNSQENYLDELIDTKSIYWQKCIDAERLCREIEVSIYKFCKGVYSRVLSNYYLYHVRLEQLAVMEKFSYAHIKRIKWRALEQYGNCLPKDEPQ